MKVCHVITRLIVGGAQENTILTCAGLVRRGHEVTLVAGPETGPEGSMWNEARRSGAAAVCVDSLRRNPRPVMEWRCLRELTTLFRRERFDIVHTHSSKAGILGRWAAHRAGVPVIVHTIHGMSFNRTQRAATRWMYRVLERRAGRVTTAFISVADAMTRQAVEAGVGPPEKFTTIYSGMDTAAYEPSAERRRAIRDEWGVRDDEIVVGTVARLFRNKGYDEIVRAMPSAVGRCAGLRFVWVGDGPDRDRYVEELRQMGFSDRVRLTGLVRPEGIPALVAGFDILLHASRWEGLPRALVQGLLMEVPGVAFDNDGAPEVIRDGETGVLAPFGDVRALSDGIVRLVGDSELRRRMGSAGRRLCLERFDAGAMVDSIDALYAGLR
ncbi:MAG: glycosyltransferase family 4 protein [Phycisphaerales bacterium]|nr:glycosyltransferase family 4 protein [Phycisphaerales bacterium]